MLHSVNWLPLKEFLFLQNILSEQKEAQKYRWTTSVRKSMDRPRVPTYCIPLNVTVLTLKTNAISVTSAIFSLSWYFLVACHFDLHDCRFPWYKTSLLLSETSGGGVQFRRRHAGFIEEKPDFSAVQRCCLFDFPLSFGKVTHGVKPVLKQVLPQDNRASAWHVCRHDSFSWQLTPLLRYLQHISSAECCAEWALLEFSLGSNDGWSGPG